MQRIQADLLIPGRGEPLRDGVVVLDGSTISYAGPASDAPDTPEADRFRVPVVMPGMWECHGHFIGIASANLEEVARSGVSPASTRGAIEAATANGPLTLGPQAPGRDSSPRVTTPTS